MLPPNGEEESSSTDTAQKVSYPCMCNVYILFQVLLKNSYDVVHFCFHYFFPEQVQIIAGQWTHVEVTMLIGFSIGGALWHSLCCINHSLVHFQHPHSDMWLCVYCKYPSSSCTSAWTSQQPQAPEGGKNRWNAIWWVMGFFQEHVVIIFYPGNLCMTEQAAYQTEEWQRCSQVHYGWYNSKSSCLQEENQKPI